MKKYKIGVLVFSICLLLVFLMYSGIGNVLATISRANVFFLLITFLVANLRILFRVIKWKVLLNDVSFKDVFYIQNFCIAFGNLVPGKLIEPFKAVFLGKCIKKPASSILPTVLWERILDMIILIFFSTFFLTSILVSGRLLFFGILGTLVFLAILIALLLIVCSQKTGFFLVKILGRFPILKSVDRKFVSSFYGTKIPPVRILLSLFFTLIVWLAEGLVLYFTLAALGISMPPLVLTGIVCLSVLVGVISFLPGGIGSMEIFLALLLTALGLPYLTAVSAVILARFISFWYDILVGGISFFIWARK